MDKTVETIPKDPLRFSLFALAGHRMLLWYAIIAVFVAEIFGVSITFTLGKFIDAANAYVFNNTGSLKIILLLVLAYPGALLMQEFFSRVTNWCMHYLTAYMRTNTYRILFDYLSLHSSTYFNDRFAGSLSSDINIIGGNVARLANFFVWAFLWMLSALVVSFVVISTASMTLALVFTLGILFLIPLNQYLSKPIILLSDDASRKLSALRGQIVDTITNVLTVQNFARRKTEIDRLNSSILVYQDADIRSDVFREKVLLWNNVLIALFVGGIAYATFMFWSRGTITLGEFVLVITLTANITQSLGWIGRNINEFSSIYGETKSRLGEILHPHDVVDISGAMPLLVKTPTILFENVSFLYEGKTKVFDDLSISIAAGEKVGIVGPSGGGKSTFIKLLLRQNDINRGMITIDGQNIGSVTQDSLREIIGLVPQEPALFHRTIKENIKYGKPDASDDEMIHAAKLAEAHDFVEPLEKGYDTLVGERGVKLSVGQRQRVAIARVILKNAPILVLDEATSALDSESEAAIQKALHTLMEGKTVLAIAHRLSTLREMDRIIVLDNGKIVQDGSHAELLKDKEGLYARLWTHQAGGFLQDK